MFLAATKIRSSYLELNSQAQALLHNIEVDAAWAWAQNTSFQKDVLTARASAEKAVQSDEFCRSFVASVPEALTQEYVHREAELKRRVCCALLLCRPR